MPDHADEQPTGELPQLHDENFSTVYSNWIQAGRTPWDIRLAFGQVRETEPDKPAIVHMVDVVMAPQMAKALIGTLAVTIKQYENANGEIPVPQSLKERISVSLSPSPSESPSVTASPSEGAPENEE